MKKELIKIAFRQNALFISNGVKTISSENIQASTTTLISNCTKLGFTFSEHLLQAINPLSIQKKLEIFELIKEICGVNKNWTPLVKQWDIPTGEGIIDHIYTRFANIFKSQEGTTLPCSHIIPDNTFPLERYNGCPFCGTPFQFDKLKYTASTNKLKALDLWNEKDLKNYYISLLQSPVALDATQVDSLKVLINHFGVLANITIKMKETSMLVIDELVVNNQAQKASTFFTSPTDILRYLWYKHTGFLQLIEPKTIIKRMSSNARNFQNNMDESQSSKIKSKENLKLKFNRQECKMYATWLENLTMSPENQCANMHSKRNIWVRVIRALRLSEYSKKSIYPNLATMLDLFHNEKYEVWESRYEQARLKNNPEETFKILKERPGLFARSLFTNMLWFGAEKTIIHFKEIVDQVPLRLIITLNMYTDIYFDKNSSRVVKPLGGINKHITVNQLIPFYEDEELEQMIEMIKSLTKEVIATKFKNESNTNQTIYIDERLFNIPLAIGDRSETIQDLPSALMGTRFPVEGNKIRLFLQWGQGLPAQHLDMDLSCNVSYVLHNEFCSFSQLVIPGCKHSGDIQRIPDQIGTAEYIEIDLDELCKREAKYVSFTCNAYSNGALSPNLVMGWMNSASPMIISESGVAYNPADVQHQIQVKQSLSKGMLFGVLDVQKREIIWMEMSYSGQITQNMSGDAMKSFLQKLESKLSIGDILLLKTESQNLTRTDQKNADEFYDLNWAMDSAKVSHILFE